MRAAGIRAAWDYSRVRGVLFPSVRVPEYGRRGTGGGEGRDVVGWEVGGYAGGGFLLVGDLRQAAFDGSEVVLCGTLEVGR